jgi:hypothetical protein
MAASHEPASLTGSRPAVTADRTACRSTWLTAADAAGPPGRAVVTLSMRRELARTPMPASSFSMSARA